MDLANIIDEKNSKLSELKSIIEKGRTENRKLNTDEENGLELLNNQIKDLENQLQNKTENKIKIENKKNNNRNMMENKFSLIQAIRNQVDLRSHSDEALEIFEAGKRAFGKSGVSTRGQILLPMEYEKRADIIAGSAGDLLGREVVAEQKLDIIGPLRNNSVLFKAGANLITGLVGDVSIPVYAGSSANWTYETSGATDGAGAFSEVTLAPKRLCVYVDVSKQFLTQDSASAEALLMSDILNAITDKLETSILDATAASQIRPAGLFNGVSYTTSGTSTFSNVVALETAVNTANALKGKLAYIVSPATLGVLKTTPKVSAQAIFIAEGQTVNGYPVYSSGHLPTISGAAKGAIFGNFDDLIVGQWGGLDILVDQYTVAIYGKVRLVVNGYFDFKVRRSASFAYAALA
jgi:HK97 family phage major capsid protein